MKVSRLESIAIAPWFESPWLLRVGRLAGSRRRENGTGGQAASPQKPGALKQGSDSVNFETRYFQERLQTIRPYQGCGAGAGAGAAGAGLFCPEPEPEPRETFARSESRSRSRLKRGGSGSERDIKSSKTVKREIKVTYHTFLYLFTDDDK